MKRVFGGGEYDEPQSRDTEVTVGPAAVVGILAGLVVLCCICFGVGYAVGHRGTPVTATASILPSSGTQAPVQVSGPSAKPKAAGQMPPQAEAAVNSVADTTSQNEQGGVSGVGESVSTTPPQVRPDLESQVRPALSTQGSASQSGGPAAEAKVHPALSQVPGWMVQVAAVSHGEDAQVLVNALRKRGYPVAVRREVSDNLVHVRVGPFATRNDANAMQQKLLSDGYNALVQP